MTEAASAVVSGTERPRLVALPEPMQRAIGALQLDGRTTCTVWLAAGRHLVTARHCVENLRGPARYSAVFANGSERFELPLSSIAVHPVYDLAVLGLGTPRPEALDAEPLTVDADPLAQDIVGADVEAAGGGLGNPEGALTRYAVHRVSALETSLLRAEGVDGAGLCRGDSGGPFLRTRAGSVVVVATSSTGDLACEGASGAVRLDVAREWLQARLDETPPTLEPCDASFVPACLESVIQTCTGGYVRTKDCADEDRWCGFRGEAQGLGCLSAACGRIDAHGLCDDGVARWCGVGTLEELDCRTVRQGCVDDAGAPRAACVPCTACAGRCVDFTSDAEHCGACERRCDVPGGRAACVNGTCGLVTCESGLAFVDGACRLPLPTDDEEPGPTGCTCRSTDGAALLVAGLFALVRRPSRRRRP